MKSFFLAVVLCVIIVPTIGIAKEPTTGITKDRCDFRINGVCVEMSIEQWCYNYSCNRGGGTLDCHQAGCACKCGDLYYNPYFKDCVDGTVVGTADDTRPLCSEAFESFCSAFPWHPVCGLFNLNSTMDSPRTEAR
jgi:hypothetical protein